MPWPGLRRPRTGAERKGISSINRSGRRTRWNRARDASTPGTGGGTVCLSVCPEPQLPSRANDSVGLRYVSEMPPACVIRQEINYK